MEELDASVESFFSKYDTEETYDKSDSVTDDKEVETKETDEKATQEETKVETSTDSDKSDDKTEDKADDNTPFHEHPRWKEVMKERKALRDDKSSWEKEKQELNDRLAKLESTPLTDEDLQWMTPKEIQEHTRGEMEKEQSLKQEISQKEKAEADTYIEEILSDIKDAWHEFDENKLLKIAEKYTEGDIEKAFDLYQQLEQTKESWATQEAKRAAKLKAAESNKSNRWGSWKATWFVSWTGWGELNLK